MRILFIQQPGEEIREIEDFPGYWASDLGRVVSAPKYNQNKWIVRRLCLDTDGYQMVGLHRDGHGNTRKVHDLVGRAFNDFSGPGDQWRHFPDPTRTNNRADNLIWGTKFENGWDKIFDNGRQEDWGITLAKGCNKNPYRLMMTLIPGGGWNHIGMFSTMEAARLERDRLCILYGLKERLS